MEINFSVVCTCTQNTTSGPTLSLYLRYIRAQHYRYQYTSLASENSAVWSRKYLKPYMPHVSLQQLKGEFFLSSLSGENYSFARLIRRCNLCLLFSVSVGGG